MTEEQVIIETGAWEDDISLYSIASVKAFAYCEEYNPYTGRTEEKSGSLYLKQGYVDGFLAGFAHRLGGGHGGD